MKWNFRGIVFDPNAIKHLKDILIQNNQKQ